MQEEIHFISNCNNCIASDHTSLNFCKLDKELHIREVAKPKKEVHKNCPLKNKQILIKLKR